MTKKEFVDKWTGSVRNALKKGAKEEMLEDLDDVVENERPLSIPLDPEDIGVLKEE